MDFFHNSEKIAVSCLRNAIKFHVARDMSSEREFRCTACSLHVSVSLWRASQGGYMFPCSLEKIGVFPLFPKNKLRCSLKFTFIKFPCSQKFCCMFPWSPEILINVPQNFNHISVFDGQYFRKFYLVSHSRDNPQQNASFVSLMNAASPLVHQQKFLSPL